MPPYQHPSAAIRRHPLTSFFILAFTSTWLAWTPYVLSADGLGFIDLHLPELIGILPGAYLGPIGSAFLVTAIVEGRAGVRLWARRLLRWPVGWRWYLSMVLVVPTLLVLATLPLPGALDDMRSPSAATVAVFVPLLLLQVITTGLAEEPGWRDFATPRLQRRHGALAGMLILGPLWGAWHLPLFLTTWGGWPHVDWVMPVEFVIAEIPLSIVMTWVFNRARQSVPLLMTMHAAINTVLSWVWPEMFPSLDVFRYTLHAQLIASTAVAAVLIAMTRGRLGYQRQPRRRLVTGQSRLLAVPGRGTPPTLDHY